MTPPTAPRTYSEFVVFTLSAIADSQKRCAGALRAMPQGDLVRAAALVALMQEGQRMDELRREAARWRAPAALADAHAHIDLALAKAADVADNLRLLQHTGDVEAEGRVARLIAEVEFHVDQVLAHQLDALQRAAAP